jgi:hypothetical protein
MIIWSIQGAWRKFHNEELHDSYPSPSIIEVIKVTVDGKGWTYDTHMEKANACRVLVGKPEGNKPAEDLDVERVILKWALNT